MIFGGAAVGVFLLVGLLLWVMKRKPYESRGMLCVQVVMGAASLVFYELGWVTDEVGRFPSIVYGVLNVDQAANTTPSLFIPGLLIVAFYLVLLPATFYFFARVFNSARSQERGKGGVGY
jgi:cytochrome d ubiquinol oxidase subunit I